MDVALSWGLKRERATDNLRYLSVLVQEVVSSRQDLLRAALLTVQAQALSLSASLLHTSYSISDPITIHYIECRGENDNLWPAISFKCDM